MRRQETLKQQSDEITVEAWIYPLSVNVDYPEIVLKGYGTAFEMYVLKDLAIDWEFHIGGWKTVNSGAGTVSLKKWLHAAGTYDGKATKVYVNGAKMGNAGHSVDFGGNGAPILIRYRLRDMKFRICSSRVSLTILLFITEL